MKQVKRGAQPGRTPRQAAARPEELEAQLEQGLAHLLAGDEAGFAAIHQRVAAALHTRRAEKGRLAELWALSRSYFERLAQAAAMAALVSGAGCAREAGTGSATEALFVTQTEPAAPVAEKEPRTYSKYAAVAPRPIEPKPEPKPVPAPAPTPLTTTPTLGLTVGPEPDAGVVEPVRPIPPAKKYGVIRPPQARYRVQRP